MCFSRKGKWTKRRCFCPLPLPDKKGPNGFSVGDFIQRLGMLAVGDDGVDAVVHGQGGCLELCAHPSGAPPGAGAPRQGVDGFVDVVDGFDQPGIGVEPGVTVVEAVDVGEDDQLLARHSTATTADSMSLSLNSRSSDSISV